MATQHAVDEASIRQQIDKLVEAIRAMDLEGVKPIYAPDIVSFDVGPPLQHVGAEAKWRNWVDAFTAFQHPLSYEIRNLTIALDGDVAFGHSLNRLSGTLKNGNSSGFWVRATFCFRIDRRQLAHCARPRLGASGSGERQSVAESRTLTVWRP